MRAELVDGNALAGVLADLFSADMTTVEFECEGCGSVGMLADAVVERDGYAAIVRCRSCTHTLVTVLREASGTRLVFGMLRSLRVT